MSFHAYLLLCRDGHYYAGHTDNLEHRFAQHQSGEIAGYTQTRRPVTLVWSQDFQTRLEALEAERQIKGWTRAKKEALIRGDWNALGQLAKKSFDTGLRSAQPLLRTNGDTGTAPQPAIILVRPQLGENIGKAARAMLNFGLTDLRLVAPRDGWPNPSAGPAAAGADVVLERARVYDSVATATADCAHVYATTVRRREVIKPVVTPAEAAVAVRAEPARSAFLFGPERSGLETDDVAVARTILTVPINPAFGSLNLAQAVILVAYEWSKGEGLTQPPEPDRALPAPQGELEGLIGQLDAMLEQTGYYYPPDRTTTTKRTLRTLLTKPGWSSQDLRSLRGVLSALEGKKPRRG